MACIHDPLEPTKNSQKFNFTRVFTGQHKTLDIPPLRSKNPRAAVSRKKRLELVILVLKTKPRIDQKNRENAMYNPGLQYFFTE